MMCNVIMLRFTCQHTLHRRRSCCKGTKHKVTRTSIKAACIAESCLTISSKQNCGSCQAEAWERTWRLRLERARAFLEKMSEHSMPGMEEVGGLVTELENQYTMDSWEARNMFAQARKSSVARVAISEYRRAASPLVQEVRPEDVVVADRRKEWADMDENDYDGNYVASTDPIHPVNTDYSHPWDDDVGSWVLNHLSPEELEAPSPDTIVDLDKSSWSWEDACPPEETKSKPTAMTRKEKNPVIVNDQLMADRDSREDVECLVAWGPEAKATSSTGQINMDDVKREDVRKGRIKEVIDAFWTTVNADLSVEQPRQRPSSPHEDKMSALLNALNI